MPIRLETEIEAAPQTVFDAARDIDVHLVSMRRYRERAIAGTTTGPIGAGETVTWRALHFGLPLSLTSMVTRFDPPRYFRDEQVRGPFARFEHDHYFEPAPAGTLMRDVCEYGLRAGPLGRIADYVFVRRRLRRLLLERARAVKTAAERAGGSGPATGPLEPRPGSDPGRGQFSDGPGVHGAPGL